ncbi:uncharacterized protein LOC114541072 [Dendronephthya gigantea]|uniref:uncharacterized protein LOC114541072 n=1 Tax=Dendronephthya gigantea TaxID=151771 RepID=UPI00106AA1C7|nr:uncharacterized protein LOC114541072 [Dendronephthya gigantea]
MSKSNGKAQENRNSAPVPHEPTVQILNNDSTDEIVDTTPMLDIDIDQLKDELGLGDIQNSLKILSDKIIQMSNANRSTESVAGSNSSESSQFDPSGDLDNIIDPQTSNEVDIATHALDSSTFLPSIFEETESVGPDVADAIAQRINDAVSKKPLETKFKELQDKYKTPKNCHLLCVPRVNLELWHDLPRHTKSKDLGLQEIQKILVKSAQPLIKLLDSVLKSRLENKLVEPSTILPMVADAVTLLGNASKRREFLRPDIAPAYQSVCSKSNPVSTNLFGDELHKHIKEIGEVNKIARKTMSRTAGGSKHNFVYKSGSSNTRYQRGGRRAFLGSERDSKGPYLERRPFIHQPHPTAQVFKEAKDRP